MSLDLQKASMWKRISAYIFDGILMITLAVAFGWLLSLILGYDGYNDQVNQAYAKYEAEYGVVFDVTQSEYDAMSQEQKDQYQLAYDALIADEDAMLAYNIMLNMTMLIVTTGILLSMILLEFVVPMLLKNGMTLGKKIFSIGVVRTDCVRITGVQLFVRTMLGKFTVETMIPIYMILMFLWGTLSATAVLILMLLLMVQLILVLVSRNHSAIHDLLAGTVTVDYASQMIFRSTDDLIDYQKKLAAEEAAREEY
jgi:uncharacterized RDD family membrane protein YckC